MPYVVKVELEKMTKDIDGAIAVMPELRRRAHEKVAEDVLKIVRRNINTAINDAHGTIKSWQESHVGSGGGYAAVRPIDSAAVTGYTDKPGAITNYIEVGHESRNGGRVAGRFFYAASKAEAAAAGERRANELAEEIEKRLEGK